MSDIRTVGSAWFGWVTDEASAMAAGQQTTAGALDWSLFDAVDADSLAEILVPQYAKKILAVDGWKMPLEYGSTTSVNALMPVAIRSADSDGVFSAEKYEAGSYSVKDCGQDTVWAGGYFIRWSSGVEVPQSAQDA
jgi:hypothetical protein